MYYYFDDTIKIADFDFNNILFNKKHENISIYVLYKTFIDGNLLPIVFDKVDMFSRDYDGTKV